MLQSQIRIRYKKFLRDPSVYFDCYNINVEDKQDIIRLQFDQKILFGKRLVHRDIILLKDSITDIQIRQSITEIPNMEIEQ